MTEKKPPLRELQKYMEHTMWRYSGEMKYGPISKTDSNLNSEPVSRLLVLITEVLESGHDPKDISRILLNHIPPECLPKKEIIIQEKP